MFEPPVVNSSSTRLRLVGRLTQIGRTIVLCLVVIASLLTFPGAIPWLVAFWVLWYTLLVYDNRPAWLPLAVCTFILIIKRVDWSPALIAMACVMVALSAASLLMARKVDLSRCKSTAWLGIAVAWISWSGMTYQWRVAAHTGRAAIEPARPVVCIGDSLTAYGYPKVLQKMISIPVVDLSANGITTDDALHRLRELIAANPQVVVIELGGHDFLRGHSRAATKENLEKIIDASKSIGAEVVLMEIPRGFIYDGFGDVDRELAREKHLELVPDTAIRRLVLWGPNIPPGTWLDRKSRLSDDGLHPNANGNVLLANYVADALANIFGSDVRARP